jgi:hypothetical protein
MTLSKVHNSSITKSKHIEVSEKDFKSSFKNKQWLQRGFKWMDEWSKEVNSRLGWEIQQHEWKFSKYTDILKGKQKAKMEILQMKNSTNQIKNLVESIINRLDQTEEHQRLKTR